MPGSCTVSSRRRSDSHAGATERAAVHARRGAAIEQAVCFRLLEGDDLSLVRAFVEVESLSNTYSLLGGMGLLQAGSEIMLGRDDRKDFFADAFGPGAAHDSSSVERQTVGTAARERWFFINGIVTSRALARKNAARLQDLLGKSFTIVHNPTQGLVHDIIESALQKFTNINTEPVARAFVEIAIAILNEDVNPGGKNKKAKGVLLGQQESRFIEFVRKHRAANGGSPIAGSKPHSPRAQPSVA
jgi:hypothetical protein